jgi:hypothetical protein
MELKLLRLEAKVALRDSRRQQRRQPAIADRLPPIAATPSSPNRSDEEVDSFDELELTPRGTNRQGVGSGLFTHGGLMHRSGGPANIAVVTRSGASVASAVTATSFQEGNDGDIENEGEDNDDVSESSKYFTKDQCSITLAYHYLIFTQPVLRVQLQPKVQGIISRIWNPFSSILFKGQGPMIKEFPLEPFEGILTECQVY